MAQRSSAPIAASPHNEAFGSLRLPPTKWSSLECCLAMGLPRFVSSRSSARAVTTAVSSPVGGQVPTSANFHFLVSGR